MTVAGEYLPDVNVWILESNRPTRVSSQDILGRGRVVLFAVPAAFSPGCTSVHLPGYVANADRLSEKGVDRVACVAVNDPWVMDAWARSQGAEDSILMVSDSNGDLARSMDMVFDTSGLGLGPVRLKRFVTVIENGVIEVLDVDEDGGIDVSSCDAVLGWF